MVSKMPKLKLLTAIVKKCFVFSLAHSTKAITFAAAHRADLQHR